MVHEFANRCDVLTFEIEHVDAATLDKLEKQGVVCELKASTIMIIQVLSVLSCKSRLPILEHGQLVVTVGGIVAAQDPVRLGRRTLGGRSYWSSIPSQSPAMLFSPTTVEGNPPIISKSAVIFVIEMQGTN